ncbi:MAG: AzlD domain-containing protein [Chloroflexota bacterium]
MNLILLFFVLGLFFLLERLSFLVFLSDYEMPPLLLKALRYVPATILLAIAMPSILRTDGAIDISLNPKIIAACFAIIAAWRTRQIFATIIAGMLAFWLSDYLLGLLAL